MRRQIQHAAEELSLNKPKNQSVLCSERTVNLTSASVMGIQYPVR
jgi:hypothetical protein